MNIIRSMAGRPMTDLAKAITTALAALMLLAWTPAGAQSAAPPVPAPAPGAAAAAPAAPGPVTLNDGYVLGAGDVVDVTVLGRPEFNPRVQIQTDGTLQLPFLGTVKAADLTVLQFRERVRNALMAGGYYADPVVNVAVSTYASRYVTVLGEVGQPGLVPVDRAYRISEILARVGGARDTGADILTLRRATGEEIKLDLKNIAVGGPAEDPIVNPGDKIFIPKAETFYVYGQISRPGTYKIDQGMTLRKAIASAGGLTTMGSEKRVKVFREGREIKKFDLGALIKNGDVVVVGERFF